MRISRSEPVPRNHPNKTSKGDNEKQENSGPIHAYPVTTPINHVRVTKDELHKVRAAVAPGFKDQLSLDQYHVAFEGGTEPAFRN